MIRPTLAALCGAALVCWRTRWRASLRRVGTVIVPRPAEFEAKLAALVRGGAGKLQVLADFEMLKRCDVIVGPVSSNYAHTAARQRAPPPVAPRRVQQARDALLRIEVEPRG